MTPRRTADMETVASLVAKHAGLRRCAAMASDRGYDESLWRLLCEHRCRRAGHSGGARAVSSPMPRSSQELAGRWCLLRCWAPR